MDAIALLVQSFDDAWSHPWEALLPTLEGVTDEEARWQAPCYAAEAPEAGWPPPGTVWWHVAHLAHYKAYYAAVVRARTAATVPDPAPRVPRATFAEDLESLRRAHDEQRAAVAALTPADLDGLVRDRTPLAEFLAATLRHDAWHGGQLAVARRLWRTRGA
ncbi:MAG: DinB family protein [Planctomycetes bacterium]|nr:DinB family protein [Planctomycetota bacterium]